MARILINALALTAALWGSVGAQAANFSAVKFELQPHQKATQLIIQNTDPETRTFDIRIQRWDGVNENGQAITSEVNGAPILLSRPVVTLAPNSQATVRIAVAQRSASASDYYRVFVDDITPRSAKEGLTAEQASFRVSASMPLQVRNIKGTTGNLVNVESGVKNTGNNVLLIVGTKLADGKIESGTSRYMFPGDVYSTKNKAEDLSWLAGIQ